MGRFGLLCFVLIAGLIKCDRNKRDLQSLLKKHELNRILWNNIPRPFEIVFPKQIKHHEMLGISTKEHKNMHHGTHEHMQHVTFQLVIENKKHKIKLEKNKVLLSNGISVKYSEKKDHVISKTVEHCHYHGHVRRDKWSSVAVSTCHGIRGVIHMHNVTYIIQPLVGGDEGMEHPHVIYKATVSEKETCGNNDVHWLPFHELRKAEFISKLKMVRAQRYFQFASVDIEKSRVLKLGLVFDHAAFQELNFTHKDRTNYAIGIGNIVDLYYRQLKFGISLTYIEFWNSKNQIHVTSHPRETLHNFLNYKTSKLSNIDYNIVQLVTGEVLDNSSIGMSIPDSICTSRAAGISKSYDLLEPQKTATVLAHMIGHNMGLKHDEDGGCICQDMFGCIMSNKVLNVGGIHPRMFASCSHQDFDITLSMGIADCLLGKKSLSFPQSCGNKILERGEECDCGSEKDCTDHCCDPNTCMLRYWAQCRTGPCCHNCTALSRSHMCRASHSECDVPEFCDGVHGECPSNNYVKDGTICEKGNGYCLGGMCPTLNQQCKSLWGKAGRGADAKCFEQFNPTGNFNGHCGIDPKSGTFAKCEPEDARCGLLHCEGGNKMPLYGIDRDFLMTNVFSNGNEYQCKVIHGPSMMEFPHMGLVQEGAKCEKRKICISRRCVSMPKSIGPRCPGTHREFTCSGNGVCTQTGDCFCNDGWGGLSCGFKVNFTRKDVDTTTAGMLKTTALNVTAPIGVSITPPSTQVMTVSRYRTTVAPSISAVRTKSHVAGISTMWLIIILASVVGGVVLIFTFTLLCYRRRSPGKKMKKSCMKSDDIYFENDSKISFGNLPSYRSDKLFHKKKRMSSDESDVGELPPPPVIVSSDGSRPEKGILKNGRRSSDEKSSSTTNGSGDPDSFGPYMYDDGTDIEAAEVRQILGEIEEEPDRLLEALSHLPPSDSFDFMYPNNSMQDGTPPSPPRKFSGYDFTVNAQPPIRPLLWQSNLPSPPKSRIVKIKNLDHLMREIDKATIELSPSPDEFNVQLSPSTCTSEDVHSSETDEHTYPQSQTSQSDHSPISINSGSVKEVRKPSFGNFSQYLLNKRNELIFNSSLNSTSSGYSCPDKYPMSNNSGYSCPEKYPMSNNYPPKPESSSFNPITIPPPMHPINVRNLFNYGQTGVSSLNRDNNGTPMGSQNGETSSCNDTTNSRICYDKSSGYSSEHDPERFSLEDISRSQSSTPPNVSAVIRTGPNQIKLFTPSQMNYEGTSTESLEHLQKLLDDLPRINAGSFERSPLSTQSSLPGSMSTPSTGPLPNPRPLQESDTSVNSDNRHCIDRSLEEICQKSKRSKNGTKLPPNLALCQNDQLHSQQFDLGDNHVITT